MRYQDIKLVPLLICTLFLVGCRNNGVEQQFIKAYETTGIDLKIKEIDIVLIIPNAGCQGCISTLEQFVLDRNGQLGGLLVVFTNYSSTKALRVRFSSKILDGPNVYLDSSDAFGQGKLSSLYPVILYLEGGKLERYEYVSPQNPGAVANLEHALSLENLP